MPEYVRPLPLIDRFKSAEAALVIRTIFILIQGDEYYDILTKS